MPNFLTLHCCINSVLGILRCFHYYFCFVFPKTAIANHANHLEIDGT